MNLLFRNNGIAMQKKIINSFVFTGVLLLFGCKNNSSKTSGDSPDTATKSDTTIIKKPAPQVITIKDDRLNAIYEHYIKLSSALTEGDFVKAKIASNAIEAGSRNMPGAAVIASSAAKITTAPDLEVQRAAYSTLSNEMILLIKKSGLEKGEVFVDYCPMALNDKGAYWLSSKNEVRNPYFGDRMLTCGEVKDTIK
jgi:hypothetical protein